LPRWCVTKRRWADSLIEIKAASTAYLLTMSGNAVVAEKFFGKALRMDEGKRPQMLK
jgi:hypothetical protein